MLINKSDRSKFLKFAEWLNKNNYLNNKKSLIDYELAELFMETNIYKNLSNNDNDSNKD